MSSVISFLERMGRDAHLRHANTAVLQQELERAEIGSLAQAAVLGDDRPQLEALVAARSNVCCMVHPPESDDDAMSPESTGLRIAV